MRAQDIMASPVVSVTPDALVREVAEVMLAHRASAVPVIDKGRLIGIISEADLLRRHEIGTEPKHSWLGTMLLSADQNALEFLQSHGRRARDVMTADVITVQRNTDLEAIVKTFETKGIRRVVVVDDGQVVGIVSRWDVLRAFVDSQPEKYCVRLTSDQIRDLARANIVAAGFGDLLFDLKVERDVAEISAIVPSAVIAQALVAAVEATPGLVEVRDEIRILPPIASGAL